MSSFKNTPSETVKAALEEAEPVVLRDGSLSRIAFVGEDETVSLDSGEDGAVIRQTGNTLPLEDLSLDSLVRVAEEFLLRDSVSSSYRIVTAVKSVRDPEAS